MLLLSTFDYLYPLFNFLPLFIHPFILTLASTHSLVANNKRKKEAIFVKKHIESLLFLKKEKKSIQGKKNG